MKDTRVTEKSLEGYGAFGTFLQITRWSPFFPVTLGRMNLAHRLKVVGIISKVMGTRVVILEGYTLKDTHVNELQRKDTHP